MNKKLKLSKILLIKILQYNAPIHIHKTNPIDNPIKNDTKFDTCVFDFDNTITQLHLWKIFFGQYNIDNDINISNWDNNSVFLIRNKFIVGNQRNPDIKLFKYATSLVVHIMGGHNRLTQMQDFFKLLSKKANIYISSNGDTQMIYYFLVNAQLIQYISGIHGRLYGSPKRKGCFLILPITDKDNINPFDYKYCRVGVTEHKGHFMNGLLNNKKYGINNILFIDDNDEKISNGNITVFKHRDFTYEGKGLTENCCSAILDYF